ncbi:NCS2 family permease [Streptomyces sp. NPDC048564]|uniref:NCS2 family permease n=1 Tax=Streptomyces sp. NPDC048564 TaxID=3155760 RepID=UPI00342E18C2
MYLPTTVKATPASPWKPRTTADFHRGVLDRFFRITERGSCLSSEVRGGMATFFAMAYVVVLNPIILSSGADVYGHRLDSGQLATATAITAAFTTLLMGVIGNMPIALAAGAGATSIVTLQLAPRMSWPDAMGIVVLAGIAIMVLVATGLRERVMNAVPTGLRKAIAIGIGLFIALIGLVDAGFISRMPDAAHTIVPLQLGGSGHLTGWPTLVFILGVLLTFALIIRKVPGAVLISILAMTILAVVINTVAGVSPAAWGLTTPRWPGNPLASPDFGLLGQVSLFGGFREVGVLTGTLFVFTVLLSCFFDAMGTVLSIGEKAKLLDKAGTLPGINKVLMTDGVATALGGATSCSGNTCYVESTTAVSEGARTGLASIVTGLLLLGTLFLTPLAAMVPAQAAAPALVAVGALIMAGGVRDIDWDDHTIAIPAFLTMLLMPFTYSITNGIGIGFIAFCLLRLASGRGREVSPVLYAASAAFLFSYLMPELGLA